MFLRSAAILEQKRCRVDSTHSQVARWLIGKADDLFRAACSICAREDVIWTAAAVIDR
jgi:hypothetical protein